MCKRHTGVWRWLVWMTAQRLWSWHHKIDRDQSLPHLIGPKLQTVQRCPWDHTAQAAVKCRKVQHTWSTIPRWLQPSGLSMVPGKKWTTPKVSENGQTNFLWEFRSIPMWWTYIYIICTLFYFILTFILSASSHHVLMPWLLGCAVGLYIKATAPGSERATEGSSPPVLAQVCVVGGCTWWSKEQVFLGHCFLAFWI